LRPVANRVASKLATAPAAEPADEQRRVVDGDRAALADRRTRTGRSTPRQRALLDERLGQRADPGEPVAGDELRHVDDVRADVAQRAGPGLLRLQPPHQRELRVDDPVLEVLRAHVPDLADAALGHQPPASATAGTRR
jgi:hypothetical protein